MRVAEKLLLRLGEGLGMRGVDRIIHLSWSLISPRSGRPENSPALQCWETPHRNQQQPVERAAETGMTSPKELQFHSSVSRTGGDIWVLGWFEVSSNDKQV